MRAHRDRANFPFTPDNEQRSPGQVDRVDTDSLVHAVGSRHLSLFVEEDRKRIPAPVYVFFALEQAVDLLPRDEDHACIALREFLISGLKLSHLVYTVRSPGSTNENDHDRFAAKVRQPDDVPIHVRQRKVRGGVALLQSLGSCFEHQS